MAGNVVWALNKDRQIDENKWVRFTYDVYKNSLFLWQYIGKHNTRYTWQYFFCLLHMHNNKHISGGFVDTLEGGLVLQLARLCIDMPF